MKVLLKMSSNRSYFSNVRFIHIGFTNNIGIKFKLSFEIEGKLKKDFNEENLEKAYDLGDRRFTLNVKVRILKKGRFLPTELFNEKIKRHATIFWTRNPQINKRIWVELIMEDHKPYLFYNFDEIKNRLFSFEREINLTLNKFEKNKTLVLIPELNAKWGDYHFTNKDEIYYKGQQCLVRIE